MLTQKKVRELFDYKDGELIRKVRKGPKGKVGIAGYTRGDGYKLTMIDRVYYFNHRLVWLYFNGYIPEGIVDHIDRNPSNNRIENLREATQQCNLRNTSMFSSNTSGVKGVSVYKRTGKWRAFITLNNKGKHLGYYDTLEEAAYARYAAEQCLDWSRCDAESPTAQFIKKLMEIYYGSRWNY